MKYGVRKPNVKKSIKARTTGKVKRQVKKAVNPLYGKKGMGIVNTLFCISTIFRKGWLTVAACLAWAVYLFFCRKHAAAKGSKLVYTAVFAIAVMLVCVNLYFMF